MSLKALSSHNWFDIQLADAALCGTTFCLTSLLAADQKQPCVVCRQCNVVLCLIAAHSYPVFRRAFQGVGSLLLRILLIRRLLPLTAFEESAIAASITILVLL